MAHWEARLGGNEVDIAELCTLAPAFDADIALGAENKYWLRSEDLNGLEDAWKVLDAARDIVSKLNGMAGITQSDHQPVEVETVANVGDDGKRHSHILPKTASFRTRFYAPTVRVVAKDGSVISETTPADNLGFARQIAGHPELKEVLAMLAGDVTWQKLRLAWEALAAFAGGESELKRVAKIEKTEYDRFKANCHNRDLSGDEALHFKSDIPSSSKMTPAQGRTWLGEVMRRMLAAKLAPE